VPEIIHRAEGVCIDDPLQVLLFNVQVLACVRKQDGDGWAKRNAHHQGARTRSDDTHGREGAALRRWGLWCMRVWYRFSVPRRGTCFVPVPGGLVCHFMQGGHRRR
jgi:hypothetical protein